MPDPESSESGSGNIIMPDDNDGSIGRISYMISRHDSK